MASIRDFKKDIKVMITQFMQECYTHLAYSPPLNQENVLDIISDADELRESVIFRINHPELKPEGTSSKQHYNIMSEEFYDRIVELTERLNSLNY